MYKVFCYDIYGHCYGLDFVNYKAALNYALSQFRSVTNYNIVKVVKEEDDIVVLSRIGY